MNPSAWAAVLPPQATCASAPSADGTLPMPLGHGPAGEPLWPAGMVGSVTHAGGCHVIAIAPAHQVTALGIDMEPLLPLAPSLWERICDAAETDELLALPAPHRGIAALERWCLKEAFFKALGGRLPLDELSLRHGSDGWQPAEPVCRRLRELGVAPERLILKTVTAADWQYAAAWQSGTS